MDKQGIVVYVTSRCYRACEHCAVQDWMKANPRYDMSLEQVKTLIKATKEFKTFYLTGGDPIRWINLLAAIQIITDAGKDVVINTARADIEELIDLSWGLVKEWRITVGGWNNDHLLKLSAYPNVKFNYTQHWAKPTEDIPNSIPADCTCGEIAVYGDFAFPCHAFMSGNGVRVEPGFDKSLVNTFDFDACKRCVSNLKARVGKPIELI